MGRSYSNSLGRIPSGIAEGTITYYLDFASRVQKKPCELDAAGHRRPRSRYQPDGNGKRHECLDAQCAQNFLHELVQNPGIRIKDNTQFQQFPLDSFNSPEKIFILHAQYEISNVPFHWSSSCNPRLMIKSPQPPDNHSLPAQDCRRLNNGDIIFDRHNLIQKHEKTPIKMIRDYTFAFKPPF